MSLTTEDLQQIREVMDASLAHHPRFDELKQEFEIRIDEVCEVMQEGFTLVSQRFDEVDRQFTEVDRRFVEVDRRFAEVDRRFTKVDGRFDEIDKRLDNLRIVSSF